MQDKDNSSQGPQGPGTGSPQPPQGPPPGSVGRPPLDLLGEGLSDEQRIQIGLAFKEMTSLQSWSILEQLARRHVQKTKDYLLDAVREGHPTPYWAGIADGIGLLITSVKKVIEAGEQLAHPEETEGMIDRKVLAFARRDEGGREFTSQGTAPVGGV